MEIEDLRNYGMAFSDAESGWPAEAKREVTRIAKQIVWNHLGLLDRMRFGFSFLDEKRRMSKIDISAIRERGMRNETFIKAQVLWCAMFSALARVIGTERAVAILDEVMDATAPTLFTLAFPSGEDLLSFGDPLAAFKAYFRPVPDASREAGCHDIEIVEDTDDAFGYDMTYCVWLELARCLGVEAACLPNCHGDEVFFPEYFRAIGIEYSRATTLATGGSRCTFRLKRVAER